MTLKRVFTAMTAALAVIASFTPSAALAEQPDALRPGQFHYISTHGTPANAAKPSAGGGSNLLTYHNGPVMATNTVYAIFVEPSNFTVSANYNTLINQYFTDVAADSGKTSNVYYTATQYGDLKSKIAYSSTFGGSWVDTASLPASGCTNAYTPNACLSDAQIQSEIVKAITANNWTYNANTLFFVFTAKNIGTCAGTSCSFKTFCAYHSNLSYNGVRIPYANMPYASTVTTACDPGSHPNGDDADATLNVTSHEHNEAITDPLGNAWYDSTGYENGDKCAWNFGASIGTTATGKYNQLINGHTYYLQQEWSNARNACVLTGL